MSLDLLREFPERSDVWRVDGARADEGAPFKEWQHFALFAKGLDLLVNFSVDDRGDQGRAARVIVMARTDAWHGALDTVAAEISRDARHGTFGAARFDIVDGGYRVSVDWPRRGISVALEFRPLTAPVYAVHRPAGDRRRLYWALVARLEASGRVTVGDRSFVLTSAQAYHDHNWGSFAWGNDFAWEWGAILPDDASSPYACVFSRVTNRARTVVRSQHLFVWRGARNVLAAESEEVRTGTQGRYEPDDRPFRIPAEMALLDSRRDVDLPRDLEIQGTVGTDEVNVRFRCESAGRILVPNEVDPLGKIVIHECLGDAAVQGTILGQPFAFGGRGVFELLRS